MPKCIQCGAYTKYEKGLCYDCYLVKNGKAESSVQAGHQSSVTQLRANTEGEKYIKEFFKEAGIKYDQQIPIRNLSHDTKAHRVADFYLPKYNVYVEFFGHWNTSEEHKENYRIKKRVYRQNHIPCVFLYPENLGYIDFAFDNRIMETLIENHQEQSLNKYKKWKFLKGAQDNIIGLIVCVIAYVIMLATKEEGKAVIIFIFLYNLFKILGIWNLVYVKGTYSIKRMLYD